MANVEDRLESAISAVAQAVNGSDSLVEGDVENALEEALHGEVERQKSVALEAWAERVGPVDLQVVDGGSRSLIEVKCGGDALWNCAWDVAKIAVALAERKADSGFLVAALPAQAMVDCAIGSELFLSRAWDAEGFLAKYGDEFAFWRTQVKNHPKRIPWTWQHRTVCTTQLTVGEAPWELHLVVIELDDPRLLSIQYGPSLRSAPPETKNTRGLEQSQPNGEHGDKSPLQYVATGEGFTVYRLMRQSLVVDGRSMMEFSPAEEPENLSSESVYPEHFRSGAGLRQWLHARKLVAPSAPDVLNIEVHGGWAGHWRVAKQGADLAYEVAATNADRRRAKVRPDSSSWRSFLDELDRLGIWDWSPEYKSSEHSTDGYGWNVAIAHGGRTAVAAGYNAFPDRNSSSDEMSPTWSDFLEALTALIGQRLF